MAKKEKKNKNLDEEKDFEVKEKKGGKIVSILIALIIILIWLLIFAFLIKLDVGGFGSKVLRPVLKDVPLINKILPKVSDKEVAKENGYEFDNLEDAIARIKELEQELSSKDKTGSNASDKIKEYKAEIKRLEVFERNQKEFAKQKKEYEDDVVFSEEAPPIEEYKKYYESIDKAHAEELYKQVVEQQRADQKVVDLAERYSSMDPAKAATTLGIMTGDLDLVSKILCNMDSEQAALILNEMDPTIAAKLTAKMSMPEQ